jgi:hypothetical protein
MGKIVGYAAERDPASVRDIEWSKPDTQAELQNLRQEFNRRCVRLSARLRPAERHRGASEQTH